MRHVCITPHTPLFYGLLPVLHGILPTLMFTVVFGIAGRLYTVFALVTVCTLVLCGIRCVSIAVVCVCLCFPSFLRLGVSVSVLQVFLQWSTIVCHRVDIYIADSHSVVVSVSLVVCS